MDLFVWEEMKYRGRMSLLFAWSSNSWKVIDLDGTFCLHETRIHKRLLLFALVEPIDLLKYNFLEYYLRT